MSDNLILLLFCMTLLLLVAAVVFLVLQERRHAAEKAALVQDYEARRDVLQEEVASLKSEKAALESRLEVQQQAQEAMLRCGQPSRPSVLKTASIFAKPAPRAWANC